MSERTTLPMSERTTLRDLLLLGGAEYANRPALRFVDTLEYSYHEVARLAEQAAADLASRGVTPGDRVVLLSENRPEWGVWYFAITSMGAAVVPILTDFRPADVSRIVDHCEPAAIVASDAMAHLLPDEDGTPVVPIASIGAVRAPHRDDIHLDECSVGEDTVAAIIYTSGTTGDPKGVVLTHGNLVSNAKAAKALVTIGTDDRLLSILPLAHTYECTIGFLVPYLSGASITYLQGPPALSRLLPALRSVRPTMMLSVPLIMEKVYQSRVVPVFAKLGAVGTVPLIRKLVHRVAAAKVKRTFGGQLRFFGVGGAALSPTTERFLREGGFPYAVGYGLTETAPLLAGTNAEETRYRATGPAVEGVELRLAPISEEEEATVGSSAEGDGSSAEGDGGAGQRFGEIQARGPNVMRGYFKNPEATARAFTSDGWFRTGDLGSIDADGYLTIRGRIKTMLLGPSGENIYPEEIEAAINTEPLVEESLVLSAGDRLVARVRLNVDALAARIGTVTGDLDADTIRRHGEKVLSDIKRVVNARLARYARLADIVLQTEALERTPTRKIKRFLYEAS